MAKPNSHNIEDQTRNGREKESDLKRELCAAKVCFLLLPEVVGLDDEGHTDLSWEKLLQRLQQRLDQLPLGAAHVDDDGEAAFAYVLTETQQKQDGSWETGWNV